MDMSKSFVQFEDADICISVALTTTGAYRNKSRVEYKAARSLKNIRYIQSDKGRATKIRGDARYLQTDAGRLTDARHRAKRKQNLGYEPINKKFFDSEGHHIDKDNVLFIPKELHRSIKHSQDDSGSMREINDAAFEWLCTQEIL